MKSSLQTAGDPNSHPEIRVDLGASVVRGFCLVEFSQLDLD